MAKYLNLTEDLPIANMGGDRFNRKTLANNVLQILNSITYTENHVIGIHGKWGSGKSSILNMVSSEIKSNKNTNIINFQPWFFKSTDELIDSLNGLIKEKFIEICEKLTNGSTDPQRKKLADLITESANLLRGSEIGGFNYSQIVDNLSVIKNNGDEFKSFFIEEKSRDLASRILVIIDEIDRLDKNEVQAIFKVIRLYSVFPGISFLIAFDYELVSKSLNSYYGDTEQSQNLVESYIDKITSIPIWVPPLSKTTQFMELNNLAKRIIEENEVTTEKDDLARLSRFIESLVAATDITPRMIVRFENQLELHYRFAINELNITDFYIITFLRLFSHDTFLALKKVYDPFKPNAHVEQLMSLMGVKKQDSFIPDWLDSVDSALYQISEQVLFEDAKNLGIWANNNKVSNRISISTSFNRYFTNGIDFNDISNESIVNFLNGESDLDSLEISSHNILLLFERIQNHSTEINLDSLIRPLCSIVKHFSENYTEGSHQITIKAFITVSNIIVMKQSTLASNEEKENKLLQVLDEIEQIDLKALFLSSSMSYARSLRAVIHQPEIELNKYWVEPSRSAKNVVQSCLDDYIQDCDNIIHPHRKWLRHFLEFLSVSGYKDQITSLLCNSLTTEIQVRYLFEGLCGRRDVTREKTVLSFMGTIDSDFLLYLRETIGIELNALGQAIEDRIGIVDITNVDLNTFYPHTAKNQNYENALKQFFHHLAELPPPNND